MQLPCPFSWPTRIANLKRCLLVERIPIADSDKELVLVNLHLEAYDDGEGKGKPRQPKRNVGNIAGKAEETQISDSRVDGEGNPEADYQPHNPA